MRHQALRFLAFIVLAVPALLRAAEPPPLPDFAVADRLMPADPMPERQTQWPDGEVILTDVVYATIPGFRPLHLDLYRPARAAGALPLIVFLHGGAWAHSNPRAGAALKDFPAVLASLARRGYAVASIEFRFSGEAPFPAQLEDLQAAIRFLRSNASRLDIEGAKVALWGMSSGAQLVALDAVNCSEGTCVQGFVGWFGLYDFAAYLRERPEDPNVRQLFRCSAESCAASLLDAASPINHVHGKDPPALLVHGMADSEVLPSQSERFATILRAAGDSAQLLLIPEVRHGFVGATPEATRDATQRALNATFEFFDRVLR